MVALVEGLGVTHRLDASLTPPPRRTTARTRASIRALLDLAPEFDYGRTLLAALDWELGRVPEAVAALRALLAGKSTKSSVKELAKKFPHDEALQEIDRRGDVHWATLTVNPATLPNGTNGTSYGTQTITATGGTGSTGASRTVPSPGRARPSKTLRRASSSRGVPHQFPETSTSSACRSPRLARARLSAAFWVGVAPLSASNLV